MHEDAIDIDGYDELNANDPSRIRIHRDCAYLSIIIYYCKMMCSNRMFYAIITLIRDVGKECLRYYTG